MNSNIGSVDAPVVVTGSDDGSIDLWEYDSAQADSALRHMEGKPAHDQIVIPLPPPDLNTICRLLPCRFCWLVFILGKSLLRQAELSCPASFPFKGTYEVRV